MGRFRLLQQIHIVDNGGQGGLDVVGYVGNQLGAHPFGAHLAAGRRGCHIGKVVQMGSEIPEAAHKPGGVHLDPQIALAHFLRGAHQDPEGIGGIEDHSSAGRQQEQRDEAVVPVGGKGQEGAQHDPASGEDPLP